MPRPQKWRKVCHLPEHNLFGPIGPGMRKRHIQTMLVEEFECLRLMDKEGLTQEECAQRMQVARTTVQRLYAQARNKVALALCDGQILKVEGGSYRICDQSKSCHCQQDEHSSNCENEKGPEDND